MLAGSPPSEWEIDYRAAHSNLEGFATDISVNRGESVNFKINSSGGAPYTIDIYRLGYYGGMGARKVATIPGNEISPTQQNPCLTDMRPDVPVADQTGWIDCGNWTTSATWAVPSNATSGVYVARPNRATGEASHIVFIVRDDAGASDLLLQTSDTTWYAYNIYGGSLLYSNEGGTGPGPGGKSHKISYNRPVVTRQLGKFRVSYLFATEYPMIRWLEANGYNVSYASGVDTDRRGVAGLTSHKVFLSVGHDEYWSAQQRANVEAALAGGVHLAFFSGNEMYWKTRWENSKDGSETPYRTLVCYKETEAGAKIDPAPGIWTGTWRDPLPTIPVHDGGRPENAVTGQLFTVNAFQHDPIRIQADQGKLRFWRNTRLDELIQGQVGQLPAGVLGYEWDEAIDNGYQPKGLIRLSTTVVPNVTAYIQNYGMNYLFGTVSPTHNLTLYRHASGALVFGAGTIQWSWGLDTTHDVWEGHPAAPEADPRMQQAMVNLFADMGVQPGTLQSQLVPATASTDQDPPNSTILTQSEATVPAWMPLTIFGTAADLGGGRPAGVEFSLDSGGTWHPANGTTNWSGTALTGAPGQVTLKTRATDDSGRTEMPGAGLSLTLTSNSSQCSLWPADAVPAHADEPNPNAVELGVRFKADFNGYITALRFYKSAANNKPHVGTLWTADGTVLATANFNNETPSGWQQTELSPPVPITAGTTYVASYHVEAGGHYAEDLHYFSRTGVDRGPLHASRNTATTPNGVYAYGTGSVFPTHNWSSSNYWVDVVYKQELSPDTTPPLVIDVSPGYNTSNADTLATVTTQFNETMSAASISSSSFVLQDPQGAIVPAWVTYDSAARRAELKPANQLSPEKTYHATIKGGPNGVSDSAGNKLSSDFSWNFSTSLETTTLWPAESAPVHADEPNPNAVELGVRFKADFNGYITALRFYKSAANNQPHVGTLWTADGTVLATTDFENETPSGWQQAPLSTPIPINAGAMYVASYHVEAGGHYSEDSHYFAQNGVDRGPLHAPANTAATPNGVYAYGTSSVFPNLTWFSGNYWVDVVYTAAPSTAPVTLWPAEAAPVHADEPNPNAVELGVRFKADFNGYITALRFYKSAANNKPHVGTLWTADGTVLATANFNNETPSGWQQTELSPPVPITAGTTYVASYHVEAGGHYAEDLHYFAQTGVDRAPLHAPPDTATTPNGVYAYGTSSVFPNLTWFSSNYWVDVVFVPR